MIQHDMMLFDHGMPRADGTSSPEQRPEADINIEFQRNSKLADAVAGAGLALPCGERDIRDRLSRHRRQSHGEHRFRDRSWMSCASISLRDNERGVQIGAGWNPHWHQPTDVFATFSDKDFRLGLNAAQTTLGAIGRLVGATVLKPR